MRTRDQKRLDSSTELKGDFFWMFSLDVIHALTTDGSLNKLHVTVDDATNKRKELSYSNFVVNQNGILGSHLCYKNEFDDSFSMRRNAVRELLESMIHNCRLCCYQDFLSSLMVPFCFNFVN